MNLSRLISIVFACAALFGCASTNIETSGPGLKEPLCQPGTEKLSALVYWGPQWRPDQKEPSLREAAALRGIEAFFANSSCVASVDVRRFPSELGAAIPSDEQLLRLAAATAPAADRVVLIVVRELGPRLVIGIPVLVKGSTEVDIEVHVLNVRTSEPMANVRTYWRNGGTFVVKGVKALDQDMRAALESTLMSITSSP